MTEIPGGLAVLRMTLLGDPTLGFAVIGAPTIYGVQKITINEKGRKQDVTSTGNTTVLPGGAAAVQAVFGDGLVSVLEADITIVQASYDPVRNLFATPQVITTGSHLRIEIFPNGLASSPWDFTVVEVESVDHEIDATALQPITIKAFTRDSYVRPLA